MWTRQLLKENAKIAFKRNYWSCVLVSFIAAFLTNTVTDGNDDSDAKINIQFHDTPDYVWFLLIGVVIATICLAILVFSVLKVGANRYYLENREHKTPVSQIVWGFQQGRYGNNVWIMFCMELYIALWTMLFIIPGIIKAFSYMMIPYILADNPHIPKRRAFEISMEMMDGHKWDAFVLGLSFIGWQFLSAITAGILGVFYVNPYVDATYAEFYTALKAEAIQKGITDSVELPGVGYPQPEFTQD